jgi:hypothetical protein
MILNKENSFVTFYELANDIGRSSYITDTECGIQKNFCYPIFSEADVRYQTSFFTNSILTSANFEFWRDDFLLTGVAADVLVTGSYFGVPIYTLLVDYSPSDLTNGLAEGDCFSLKITITGMGFPTFISNQCFKKISDRCLTSQLVYTNTSNAFGFTYDWTGVNVFNVIRLPIYFKEPIVNGDKNVYVRSDGSRKLLSARLSKSYKGYVDSVTEEVHQKLVVALNHDTIEFYVETNPNAIRCRFEDEYNNEFPTIMQNVSIWPADFTIFETPFNNFNSNCG